MFLERRNYRNPRVRLAAVSQLVANKLLNHFQRADVAVIPNGVDAARLFPAARLPVVEKALETAALILGTEKSRGYCLEMICADFLADANLHESES